MKDALTDNGYQKEVISWIDRWVLSEGKKGDFFNCDPVTPDFVKAILKLKTI